MELQPSHIIKADLDFESAAEEVFEYQLANNPVYRRFCESLGKTEIKDSSEIPLLPIEAFKEAELFVGAEKPELLFQSSGTTSMTRSQHFVNDPEWYKTSLRQAFDHFYGLTDYVIWAYTPGYSDNPNSSLIWMLNDLIAEDETELSQFLPLNEALDLSELEGSDKKLMLFGAAFGLIDLADDFPIQLPEDSIIMETGGMKTFKREMSRDEMHEKLASAFGLIKEQVHSEYGMTELLSQAYSLGNNWFRSPAWMKVSIRNPENPLVEMEYGMEGQIGVIDLANVNSCPFILTGDKGIQHKTGPFQVLGRLKNTNLRGCNFLIDQD